MDNYTLPAISTVRMTSFSSRCIHAFLSSRVNDQPQTIENLHKNFWQNQTPEQWYKLTENRFEDIHIPVFQRYVEQIKYLAAENDITHFCEFGTGNGKWINYLNRQLELIEHFIGIDISFAQIEKNQRQYNTVEFIQADIVEWIKNNAMDHCIYHTNCGVLEYLTENSVSNLMQCVCDAGKNNVLFLIEPLADDYDLEVEHQSRLYGSENSYTHNYPYLLKQSGFHILQMDELQIPVAGGASRMLVCIAKPEP